MTNPVNWQHKEWESMPDDLKDMIRENKRNWRSWGSWFSWGSPVGLGLWFVLMAAAFWIIMQAIQ